MNETAAGHYTVYVSDLGKLCYLQTDAVDFELCDDNFESENVLNHHISTDHGDNHVCQMQTSPLRSQKPAKSVLKPKKENNSRLTHEEIVKEIEGELSIHKIERDLNTLMNRSPSKREKKMIKVIRNIAKLNSVCDECKTTEMVNPRKKSTWMKSIPVSIQT